MKKYDYYIITAFNVFWLCISLFVLLCLKSPDLFHLYCIAHAWVIISLLSLFQTEVSIALT